MSDTLPLRLRLALGDTVRVGAERAARGGVRRFDATLPGRDGPATHRVTLAAPPPDGPLPAAAGTRAAACLALAHPGLAAVLGAGEFEGRAWLAEAAPAVPPLADRLEAGARWSVRDTIATLRGVARVLAVLHRRGIAHGAIAPDTVHLAPDGRVTVAVGVAEGTVLGDLHALGRLVWTMLNGGAFDLEQAAPRWSRSGVPPELRILLDRMASPEPERRPARAEDVLAALDAFPVARASPLVALFEGAGRGARDAERHPILLLAVLAGAALLVVLLLRHAA